MNLPLVFAAPSSRFSIPAQPSRPFSLRFLWRKGKKQTVSSRTEGGGDLGVVSHKRCKYKMRLRGKKLCKEHFMFGVSWNVWASIRIKARPPQIRQRLTGISGVRVGRGGKREGGTDGEDGKIKTKSFFFDIEWNELWNHFFLSFVLFNIKPYLLYWKLQRLLSNDTWVSQSTHKSFLTKYLHLSLCLLFLDYCAELRWRAGGEPRLLVSWDTLTST